MMLLMSLIALADARDCVRTVADAGSCSPVRGWEPTRSNDAIECTRLRGDGCSRTELPPTARPRKGRVHFTGCGKNVAHALKATADSIEVLGNAVRDYSVMVYLDASADGSEDRLREWVARNARVTGLLSATVVSPERTARLAFCRNVCLREALRPAANMAEERAADIVDPPRLAAARCVESRFPLSQRPPTGLPRMSDSGACAVGPLQRL